MTYLPELRDTLLIPSGTFEAPDKKHLFIVMTEACAGGQHFLLSASTIRTGVFHDSTCTLAIGCHSFITAPSYIAYAKAMRVGTDHLVKCVEGWLFTPKDKLSTEEFARVCAGVKISPFTPKWAKIYFDQNGPS